MTTRRSFIAGAAAVAGIAAASAVSAPAPAQAATPSTLARELARSLQRNLPEARLSDAITAKIASDIEDNFAIATTFRKGHLKNGDEPACAFAADPAGEPG
jgi:hypothetical protein